MQRATSARGWAGRFFSLAYSSLSPGWGGVGVSVDTVVSSTSRSTKYSLSSAVMFFAFGQVVEGQGEGHANGFKHPTSKKLGSFSLLHAPHPNLFVDALFIGVAGGQGGRWGS